MTKAQRTHLEHLTDWIPEALPPQSALSLHQQWMSPLLPTRRFGDTAWAAFRMANSPRSTEFGAFCGWTVFDARAIRLLAHLEPPVADRFGVVPHFPKPSVHLTRSLLPALGRAGAQFFDRIEPGDDAASVRAALRALNESYLSALRIAAPDFLIWLGT